MNPKVSIVIPVYNGADYLDEAIQSVFAQSYKNIEVIIINDGSDDEGSTERIALHYKERIRYFSKPNGGVASALNFAIREMSGDYFSWLSHDDLYDQDKVRSNIEALADIKPPKRERTVIYSDYSVFSSSPENAVPVRLPGVPPEFFRYWLTIINSLHGCTLMVPKTAFAECGIFNEGLKTTQDFDLWFRLAEKYNFTHIPQVLVKARSHGQQGSIRMASTALTECDALLEKFMLALTERELTAGGQRSLAIAYAEISASFWRRGFLSAAQAASKLSIRRLFDDAGRSAIPALWILSCGIAQYHALPVARNLIAPPLRQLIKRFLFPSSRLAAIPHGQTSSPDFLKRKFSEIYDKNIFGGGVSRSGAGSDLVQSEVIRRELPALLKKLHVQSLLDAPCGDWYWMGQVDLDVETYIGVDIVEALILGNQKKFGNASRNFLCLNLTQDDLPKVDLIFSRDCLVHLSLKDALRVIANFKRTGSKYLLTTTFINRDRNNELAGKDNFWRPLNMQRLPFNFPPPLQLINEGCTEENGVYTDKCLGLWLLQDIEC